MLQESLKKIKLFIGFSNKDVSFLLELEKHLSTLKELGYIETWNRNEISFGKESISETKNKLDDSDLIICLLSSDFMATEYFDKDLFSPLFEMEEKIVLPILVRPVIYAGTPFEYIKILPSNRKAISQWSNEDEAWVEIVKEIHYLCEQQIENFQLSNFFSKEDKKINAPKIHCPEIPDISLFVGRENEIQELKEYLIYDHANLVFIQGLKGVGKTDLSVKIAHELKDNFDFVIWKKLLNAPDLIYLISDINNIIHPSFENINQSYDFVINQFHDNLNKNKCLIILDNFESVLTNKFNDYEQFLSDLVKIKHGGCLIITSREIPKIIDRLVPKRKDFKIIKLDGLNYEDGIKIFNNYGDFKCDDVEKWKFLINSFNGNPLALELLARHIDEVFFGDVNSFLEEGLSSFDDFNELLDWHYDRLSLLEKEVIYWLTINREPVSYISLKDDIYSENSKEKLSSTLQSLQRKIPLERVRCSFMLQPVLIEYTTQKIIKRLEEEIFLEDKELKNVVIESFLDKIKEEIKSGKLHLINSHVIFKATSKEHIRENQKAIILFPLIRKLLNFYETPENLAHQIKSILEVIKNKTPDVKSYAPTNLITILIHLDISLKGWDFSRLYFKEIYLQGYNLQGINFSHSTFSKFNITQNFGAVLKLKYCNHIGKLIASTTSYNIYVYSENLSTTHMILKGHEDWVWDFDVLESEHLLISGSEDKTIKIWSLNSGECLKTIYDSKQVRAISVAQKNKLIASGTEEHSVKIWDINSGALIQKLEIHKDIVRAVIFSNDNRVLVSASDEGLIVIWSTITWSPLKILKKYHVPVTALDICQKSMWIASGGDDGKIIIWDLLTGNLIKEIYAHSSGVKSIKFNSSSNILISSDDLGFIKIWDISTSTCVNTIKAHGNIIRSIDFNDDGLRIYSGSEDETIKIWDTLSLVCLNKISGYDNAIWDVKFAPNSTNKVFLSDNHNISEWNCETEQVIKRYEGHRNRSRCILITQDSTTLISASEDNEIKLWDISTGECVRTFKEHLDYVYSVDIFGELMVSGGEDNLIKLWNINDCTRSIRTLNKHQLAVYAVKFSFNGEYFASAGEDNSIIIWSTNSFEFVHELKEHKKCVRAICFSNDDKLLISSSEDSLIKIWDINSGLCITTLKRHKNSVKALAMSKRGNLFASGSDDKTIFIWKTNGEFVKELTVGSDSIKGIDFSYDDKKLICAIEDGTSQIWNLETFSLEKVLRPPRPFEWSVFKDVKGFSDSEIQTIQSLGGLT